MVARLGEPRGTTQVGILIVIASEGRSRRGSPQGGGWSPAMLDRGRLEKALVLVLESADTALSRKLGRVVQSAKVWGVSRHQGLLQELDHGALENDNLGLELGLRNH